MRTIARVETISVVGDDVKFRDELDTTIYNLNECGETFDITFSTNSELYSGREATRYTAFISVYKAQTR